MPIRPTVLRLFKITLVDTRPFVGPMMPLFWTSGDISSGFQSQSGQIYLHFVEVYVMYISWDSSLVLHLLTSWQPTWLPSCSHPHARIQGSRLESMMADPGFSPGGGANSQKCYYFSIFCRKLHENERIWTPRGGRASLAPPLGSANAIIALPHIVRPGRRLTELGYCLEALSNTFNSNLIGLTEVSKG